MMVYERQACLSCFLNESYNYFIFWELCFENINSISVRDVDFVSLTPYCNRILPVVVPCTVRIIGWPGQSIQSRVVSTIRAGQHDTLVALLLASTTRVSTMYWPIQRIST